MTTLVPILYIISFALFIYGLMGLTGPKTAVRGNKIAAVGMTVATVATLLLVQHNWILIVVGLVIGVALGVPSARQVKMTAIPQMVALFNGVGGGAVALIAWSEFRTTGGFLSEAGQPIPAYVIIASMFGAIIGSISFWGSLIAFGKLQEILPGRPIGLGKAQQFVNGLLLLAAIACAVVVGLGGAPQIWIIALLVLAAAARRAGGAADRWCRHAGGDLPAERVDRALRSRGGARARQHGDDRGRHDRRRFRLDPDQPDGHRDEPLHPGDRGRRVRGHHGAARCR